MGTWGIAAFEDDTAKDYLWSVEENPSIAFLLHAIADALKKKDDELESTVGVEARAAAEILAALNGHASIGLPGDVEAVLARFQGEKPVPEELQRAALAIARLRKVGELRDVWQDSEDYDRWDADMADLEDRLV